MAGTNSRYLPPGFRRATSTKHIERSLNAVSVTVYQYHCPFRGTDRTLRYVGDCTVCGRRTWAADDGENDPRGIMGDHATHALVAGEYGMTGPDVALCALCGNEYEPYKAALDKARRHVWKYPDDVTGQ